MNIMRVSECLTEEDVKRIAKQETLGSIVNGVSLYKLFFHEVEPGEMFFYELMSCAFRAGQVAAKREERARQHKAQNGTTRNLTKMEKEVIQTFVNLSWYDQTLVRDIAKNLAKAEQEVAV